MIGLETGIAMIDAETIDMMTGVGMTGMTGAMMTEAATMTEVAMKTEAAMKTGEVMIGVTTGMMIAMKIGEGQTAGTRDRAVVVVCERLRIPCPIECKKASGTNHCLIVSSTVKFIIHTSDGVWSADIFGTQLLNQSYVGLWRLDVSSSQQERRRRGAVSCLITRTGIQSCHVPWISRISL